MASAGATGPTRAGASSDAPSTPILPGPGFASSGSAPASASASARPSASAAEPPTWSDPPSLGELGPIGWFRAKLDERPVRADRSRELHGEGRGRFDRLDLWLLVVLVVSILGIRMWRLAEPYQMHFDEVYHARTATEFVQDWRYGISHDIYEWTHPHLAKYAMAGGLVAWGNDRVTATSDLGGPVVDAAIEPRTDDPTLPAGRAGDRVDVVTGLELRSYDLSTRKLIATIAIDGASAVGADAAGSRVFVGTRDGTIVTIEGADLDALRAGRAGATIPEPTPFATLDRAVRRLFVSTDGGALLAILADDRAVTLDATTAEVRGTVQLDAAGDVASAGTAPALTASADAVEDPVAAAGAIAQIVGGDAATYEARLRAAVDRTVIAPIGTSEQKTNVQKAIDDGRLAGLSIENVDQIAVADANGVEMIDPGTGVLTRTVDVGAPAHGLALTTVDDAKLYVATDPDPATTQAGRISIVAVGGNVAKDGPVVIESLAMPGPVSRVAYDDASEMVHVLGRTPDRSASTVYVIEPHARAVYADARLPFDPSAWVMDAARMYPGSDREQVLAFGSAGQVASVDVGEHEFAWRLPGVLAGAAMAAFLYILTRILFRRRSVALLVAILSLTDGMFFVQSRIGMNDAYVGLFIVAAYTVFAALWLGVWKNRAAFWIAMPVIGAFLGLGLASKWVALYAVGGIGLLILARSALGRLITIVAMIGLTAVLGYLAINVPAGSGFGNLPFVAIMVGLTVVAVVANVTHPLAWSLDEIRFSVGGPIVAGGLAMLALIATGRAGPAPAATVPAVAGSSGSALAGLPVSAPMAVAIAVFLLGPAVWLAFAIAGRVGFGPLAGPARADSPAALLPPPSSPPAASWLRIGALAGLPVIWMVVCLIAIPLAIYVASYIPWAFVENHRLFANWPNGHTGQSLVDLTGAMYAYHNGLAAPHAASSPWWAWLFDFKPVWFYQESYAANTTGAIYDAGNLVAWWLGIPAMAFVGWQAYARRSLPLALIAIGYACQWVSWARIDRAAFQYHYYTSLPFLFLALAYFLAELWHGASRRTWLLARLAAGVAILGPALLWIFDRPLCAFVGVTRANPGSQACPPVIPQFLLTSQTAAMAAVVGVSVLVVIRLLGRLGDDGSDSSQRRSPVDSPLLPLVITAVAAVGLTVGVRWLVPDQPILTLDRIPVEPVAVILALPAVALAVFVATARDARRFVLGAVAALVAWFVIVYPNFSALPLPTAIANVYQGVLPTYLYAFQFPVNNVAATVPVHLLGPVPLLLGGAMVFLAIVVAYSAWVWRLALAERHAEERDRFELGGGRAGAGGGAAGD
ncbi:MAG TPA: phospholipid carrier-dependent glycosyltransferase [Candidatus Limnocylindrales bacterium]|nr:phospholipid carrier-dependent glycosyltransferase [Candidatus Limnocylindrales bacterium]